MHLCISKLDKINSDKGLSSGRRYVVIFTNAGILLIRTLRTNFTEILKRNSYIFIHENAFENTECKMASISSGLQWVYELINKL